MRHQKLIVSVLAVSAAVLLSAAMLTATSADAARGGGGGKGGNGGGKPTPTAPPSTATVSIISQNPVPVGTAPTFHATGYAPGAMLYMAMSGYIQQEVVYADTNGSVTYTFYKPMYNPGGYTFSTSERNGVNRASVSFTVQ